MPRKRKSEPLHLLRKRDDSPPAGRETNYGLDKLPTGLHSLIKTVDYYTRRDKPLPLLFWRVVPASAATAAASSATASTSSSSSKASPSIAYVGGQFWVREDDDGWNDLHTVLERANLIKANYADSFRRRLEDWGFVRLTDGRLKANSAHIPSQGGSLHALYTHWTGTFHAHSTFDQIDAIKRQRPSADVKKALKSTRLHLLDDDAAPSPPPPPPPPAPVASTSSARASSVSSASRVRHSAPLPTPVASTSRPVARPTPPPPVASTSRPMARPTPTPTSSSGSGSTSKLRKPRPNPRPPLMNPIPVILPNGQAKNVSRTTAWRMRKRAEAARLASIEQDTSASDKSSSSSSTSSSTTTPEEQDSDFDYDEDEGEDEEDRALRLAQTHAAKTQALAALVAGSNGKETVRAGMKRKRAPSSSSSASLEAAALARSFSSESSSDSASSAGGSEYYDAPDEARASAAPEMPTNGGRPSELVTIDQDVRSSRLQHEVVQAKRSQARQANGHAKAVQAPAKRLDNKGKARAVEGVQPTEQQQPEYEYDEDYEGYGYALYDKSAYGGQAHEQVVQPLERHASTEPSPPAAPYCPVHDPPPQHNPAQLLAHCHACHLPVPAPNGYHAAVAPAAPGTPSKSPKSRRSYAPHAPHRATRRVKPRKERATSAPPTVSAPGFEFDEDEYEEL